MDTRVNPSPEADALVRPKNARQRRIWPWLLLVLAAVAGAILLREPWKRTGPGIAPMPSGRPGAAAAQAVAVAAAAKGDIPVTLTSLGTVTSLATVTVRSQISGYLTEIHFREGQMVKKGDLLAQIDPRPYEAALAQVQGQLERDQALLENARLDVERYERLIKTNATPKQTLDTAVAAVRQYEGTVRSDQGQVDAQKLNLVYCRIVSPVEGRAGLRQVDAGNFVTAADPNGIVVVAQLDPISVTFTLPEIHLRQLMKRYQAGAKLPVSIYDRSNTEKRADGILDTVDNQVDTSTGTVKLRALFQNADGALFPNEFVNVALLLDTLHDAVTVPAAAIQSGVLGTFVYLVNTGNSTVSVRKVQAGPAADGRVAVLSGLASGDIVVTDGADRLTDGAKVAIPGEILQR
jgi:multidrug efflux system membrane fusion protein